MNGIDWEREIESLEQMLVRLRNAVQEGIMSGDWHDFYENSDKGPQLAQDALAKLQRQIDLIKWRLEPSTRRPASAQVNRELAWAPLDF